MRARYQRGYLRIGHRKTGPACWEFLWRDKDLTGRRVRRKAVIGTVEEYRNVEDAWQASNGLRVSINEARNRQREESVTVADLLDHYTRTELSDDPTGGGKSCATRTVYQDFLTRWVVPAWGSCNIRAVRITDVEKWLHQLKRADGNPVAPSTKAKIRNVMSVLFNHAIRYKWLEQGKNPILLVRQGAKRQSIPECLEAEELRALLSQLSYCFRVTVLLDAGTGLRRSELLALKWEDIDFERLQINVQHSICMNVVGHCKTEASRKSVPLDVTLASALWTWKQGHHIRRAQRLGICEPSQSGQEPVLARHASFARDTTGRCARWTPQAHRMAHVSAQLCDHADGKRREREGSAGAHAPR